MFEKKNTIRYILLPLLFLPALVLAQGMSSNLVLLKVNDSESALEYNASGSNHGRCVSGPGNGSSVSPGGAISHFGWSVNGAAARVPRGN